RHRIGRTAPWKRNWPARRAMLDRSLALKSTPMHAAPRRVAQTAALPPLRRVAKPGLKRIGASIDGIERDGLPVPAGGPRPGMLAPYGYCARLRMARSEESEPTLRANLPTVFRADGHWPLCIARSGISILQHKPSPPNARSTVPPSS